MKHFYKYNSELNNSSCIKYFGGISSVYQENKEPLVYYHFDLEPNQIINDFDAALIIYKMLENYLSNSNIPKGKIFDVDIFGDNEYSGKSYTFLCISEPVESLLNILRRGIEEAKDKGFEVYSISDLNRKE